MKQLSVSIAGLFLTILSMDATAQSKAGADYFAGKWNVIVKGTPNGDAKMSFVLDKKEDKISGVVQDSTGTEISKISNVDLKDTTTTLYFTASGYDVNLILNKKDDDHVSGSLMNMFQAEGERVKDGAAKK